MSCRSVFFSLSVIPVERNKMITTHRSGLRNEGNTCWANSLIQVLTRLDAVRESFAVADPSTRYPLDRLFEERFKDMRKRGVQRIDGNASNVPPLFPPKSISVLDLSWILAPRPATKTKKLIETANSRTGVSHMPFSEAPQL